ncbi:hypothetical protein LXA43DRAFT_1035272 [Ganoderma leucocontextum]|nr:hypothetical protein LXA43DRAFT_1035272 [Ganoderma leucocontextum]
MYFPCMSLPSLAPGPWPAAVPRKPRSCHLCRQVSHPTLSPHRRSPVSACIQLGAAVRINTGGDFQRAFARDGRQGAYQICSHSSHLKLERSPSPGRERNASSSPPLVRFHASYTTTTSQPFLQPSRKSGRDRHRIRCLACSSSLTFVPPAGCASCARTTSERSVHPSRQCVRDRCHARHPRLWQVVCSSFSSDMLQHLNLQSALTGIPRRETPSAPAVCVSGSSSRCGEVHACLNIGLPAQESGPLTGSKGCPHQARRCRK